MTGGTWLTQNKVRPGAYINFKSVPEPLTKLGTRGIMTMPLALDWGPQVIELLSTDLLNGKSLAKIGYTAFDTEAQIFREALRSAYKAIIYRLDTGGVKATLTIAPLVSTAKYAGICGNKIKIAVVAKASKFDVITFYNDIEKDRQTVTKAEDLIDNDFVDFSGTGNVVANAGASLIGGTNGTVTPATAYPGYLAEMGKHQFNTMAVPTSDATVIPNIVTFIKNLRDVQGVKCQAVVYNYPVADHEGIISSINGYKTSSETVSAITFIATVAGLTAAATIKDSLTNYLIEGATEIIGELDNEGIIDALNKGQLVLSKRQSGKIKIEKDINTFTSFVPEKNYDFSKNRIIRTLDEVNNTIKSAWEENFEGKVDNNAAGRTIYNGECLHILNTMEGINAIQNVDSKNDIILAEGDEKDSLLAYVGVEPVDAFEKLYMTVNVR